MITTDDDLMIADQYDKGLITDAEVRARYGKNVDKFFRILKTTRTLRMAYRYALAAKNVQDFKKAIELQNQQLASLDKFVEELTQAKLSSLVNYSGGRISVAGRTLELRKMRGNNYRVEENTFDGWYNYLSKLDKQVSKTIPHGFGEQPANQSPYTVKLERQDWKQIRVRLIEEINLLEGQGVMTYENIQSMLKQLDYAEKMKNASLGMFIASLINDACNTIADLIKMSAW